ncbi:hypothetical protein QYE76_017693 [Lolium multiflorum]|uniref:Aminotransferase-like plant mobile domain-containing protein n=1 Tax=Lolium multiflorum TaxID=4521 RepID=A0AAD8Q3T7_LOLMU|nr:hypothetical protein QYE76_017693 [Lolium multiflorum]
MAESSNANAMVSGLKNENILKTIGYFWSDALNCFMFGHGPMTPTLLDVAMITGLDIASSSPSAFKLPKVPFTLSSKTECTSWGAYLRRYMKTKGPVTEKEHTAFLNFWLEHFIFCGPSLAPTKNYLSLAYELAKGTQLGLGKLFLGETSTEENSSGEAQSSQRDSNPGNSGRSTTQSQTDSPASASRKRSTPEPVAPQAPIKTGSRVKRRCVKRARKDPRVSSPSQEVSNTNETSSGDVEEVLMPSATLDLATSTSVADQVANLAKSTEKPIITTSAAPPTSGEGCDLSSLLTFDPESIEPATSKAGEEPSPSTVHGPLQRLKALLSSSVETLVENPEAVKGILEDIQPHLPVTLQVKLWPAVTLSVFRSRVQSARQRITLRHAQLPLRADIADKCQRLNEKKAALDAKTDTSANSAELETLRKELENLEERVRVTKQLIQDKETLIARSQEEAKGLTADLKTDLAEIRTLSSQLVTGKDEDDEAEIAEVDRIRADALHALNAFLQ